MTNYFTEWFHTYIVHFGGWVSFIIVIQLHKNGLPDLKNILKELKIVIILSLILSVFSSHSQNHYIQHFKSIGTK